MDPVGTLIYRKTNVKIQQYKHRVKKASSQINLQASVWISFIRIITSIWKKRKRKKKLQHYKQPILASRWNFKREF